MLSLGVSEANGNLGFISTSVSNALKRRLRRFFDTCVGLPFPQLLNVLNARLIALCIFSVRTAGVVLPLRSTPSAYFRLSSKFEIKPTPLHILQELEECRIYFYYRLEVCDTLT
jgi:hypothetical protein